jgi:4-diphosphocytidyl-2-C-methyl-D-erythritol kinase
MISYPNAKINLGLNVVEKRPDGYHNIETVFYPVPFCDILEILPAVSDVPSFTASGLVIPGPPDQNLCLKAVDLILTAVRRPLSAVSINLHKMIPPGSGLGGGSSDAAFTLKMMNDLNGLSLSGEDLSLMAARLGSDCPFFIRNRPAFAEGRGDVLKEIEVGLHGYFLAIVIPPVHVKTAGAYGMITPGKPAVSVREAVGLPVEEWKGKLINDFEKPMVSKFPEIGEVKEKLYELGAVYASMSGSGSAVYGLFKNAVPLADQFPINYFSHISQL